MEINPTSKPKTILVLEIDNKTDNTKKPANECNKIFIAKMAGRWAKLFAESIEIKIEIIDYLKDKKIPILCSSREDSLLVI